MNLYSTLSNAIRIRYLGLADYQRVWQAMRVFTCTRHRETADELWVLEHPPVYTQGQAGRPEHLLTQTAIPLLKTDRGGQITYHGPGQLIVYVLLNLRRHHLSVWRLVRLLEQSVVACLHDLGVNAYPKEGAPGVYVMHPVLKVESKIASLGLRIRNACSYHGLALNVDMDLGPFSHINPCGSPGLAVAQLADFGLYRPPVSLSKGVIEPLLVALGGKSVS